MDLEFSYQTQRRALIERIFLAPRNYLWNHENILRNLAGIRDIPLLYYFVSKLGLSPSLNWTLILYEATKIAICPRLLKLIPNIYDIDWNEVAESTIDNNRFCSMNFQQWLLGIINGIGMI